LVEQLLEIALNIAVRNQIPWQKQRAWQYLKERLDRHTGSRNLRIERIPPKQLGGSAGSNPTNLLNEGTPLVAAPQGDDAASRSLLGVTLGDQHVCHLVKDRLDRQSAPEPAHVAKRQIADRKIVGELPASRLGQRLGILLRYTQQRGRQLVGNGLRFDKIDGLFQLLLC